MSNSKKKYYEKNKSKFVDNAKKWKEENKEKADLMLEGVRFRSRIKEMEKMLGIDAINDNFDECDELQG